MNATIYMTHGAARYPLPLDFSAVREVETELGSVKSLESTVAQNRWRAEDLVTLAHILLARAGLEIDYMALGDAMLKAGFSSCLPPLAAWLKRACA